jgi:hypothetical protein
MIFIINLYVQKLKIIFLGTGIYFYMEVDLNGLNVEISVSLNLQVLLATNQEIFSE